MPASCQIFPQTRRPIDSKTDLVLPEPFLSGRAMDLSYLIAQPTDDGLIATSCGRLAGYHGFVTWCIGHTILNILPCNAGNRLKDPAPNAVTALVYGVSWAAVNQLSSV